MRLGPEEWASHTLAAIPPEWIDPIVKETEVGDTVLEWGVGTGDHGVVLKMLGRRNLGADFSRDLINKILYGKPGIYESLKVADWTEPWPYEDKSVDVVFSSGLTEHWTEEELVPIFKEHLRVAKKKIIHLAPNADCEGYMKWKAGKEASGTWEYGQEIPRRTYLPIWEASGFKNDWSDRCYGVPRLQEYSVGTQFGGGDEKYLLVTVIDL